ncbi:chorismate dehydratase [Bacteroidia bacterium]|nr:chorismate dehydratase [Bacteroidia bacterium]
MSLRVAAVSYLNTVPMVYGIRRAAPSDVELLLSPPSGCAAAFASGEAQMALLPSAALMTLPGARVVSDYCIGAHGDVRTVVIMSNVPISRVRRLMLDSHSLTSVALSAVLCRRLWRVSPERVPMGDMTHLDEALATARPDDAFLLIGDKVFAHEGRMAYTLDLAGAWRELTGLPFVFAVWVAAPGVDDAVIDTINASLRYGVEHISEAVAASDHRDMAQAADYLTHNIDFRFDEAKRRSLGLFLDHAAGLCR